MNGKIFRFLIFLSLVFLTVYKPHFCSAQLLEKEEDRLAIEKTGVSGFEREIESPDNQRQLDIEIKYLAGPDKKWFTGDDQVCRYYPAKYDLKNRMVKKSYLEIGKDNIPYTDDDELKDYQIFQYDRDGRVTKEITFDGKKVKQFTIVYSYGSSGLKIKAVRYDTKGRETGYTTFKYGPNNELIEDVEYKGKDIEKYHRFHHDHATQYGRVVEFLASKDGAGKDGVWFNEDDVVSSAKECFYNDDGSKDREKKYLEAGPDGKWFTKDDEMQYYTVFHYKR
jgi:hypothetical protein